MRPTDLADVLQSLEAGTFLDKVQAVVSDVAMGAIDHKQKGKFSLSFDMTPIDDSSQIKLGVDLKYERPRARGKIVETHRVVVPMFVNSGGKVTLMPEDPLKQSQQMDAFIGNGKDTANKTEERS